MSKLMPKNSYGKAMSYAGLLMLTPLVLMIFDPDQKQYAAAFLIPAIISVILGYLVGLIKTDKKANTFASINRSSIFYVMFIWDWFFLLGAIPFVLGGQMDFLHGLFESISGFTTTGLTVCRVFETPRIFLFHRTICQYYGGLGLVLMLIIILREKTAVNLFSAEGHSDKLMPNIRKTAAAMFAMYNVIIVLGTIGFRILGMGLFDALNHTVTSLLTGGFSTRSEGYVYWNSPAINLWSVLIMLCGCFSATVLLLFAQGNVRKALRVGAVRLFLSFTALFVVISAISLMVINELPFGQAAVTAIANVVSGISTCGNYYGDITAFNPLFVNIIIICMIMGGCVGSTTGGIKMDRILIALKSIWATFVMKVSSSRRVFTSRYNTANGSAEISEVARSEAFNYIVIYLMLLFIGTCLMCVSTGCSIGDGLFEFASALGGVGSSAGLTGPDSGSFALIVEMAGMILGRFEIYMVFVGFYYVFDLIRKPKKEKKA